MAVEIERKFLVHPDRLPPLKDGRKMIQGYLSESPSVRFRIVGNVLQLTVKEYQAAGRRFELETPVMEITEQESGKLQELAVCPPIVKVRYVIPFAGLPWEVDVYQAKNSGLITAEVELPRPDYPIVFPDWVDPDAEITFNSEYSNLNLGRNPFCDFGETQN